MMNTEKIEQLMNSTEFMQKVDMVDSLEAMQDLFTQYGVNLTLDELKQMVATTSVDASGELSEDDLDGVAGGGILDWIKKLHAWLSKKNTDDINDILSKL